MDIDPKQEDCSTGELAFADSPSCILVDKHQDELVDALVDQVVADLLASVDPWPNPMDPMVDTLVHIELGNLVPSVVGCTAEVQPSLVLVEALHCIRTFDSLVMHMLAYNTILPTSPVMIPRIELGLEAELQSHKPSF